MCVVKVLLHSIHGIERCSPPDGTPCVRHAAFSWCRKFCLCHMLLLHSWAKTATCHLDMWHTLLVSNVYSPHRIFLLPPEAESTAVTA